MRDCHALLYWPILLETSTNELKSFIRSCTNATLVTQLNQIFPNFEIHPNQEYILSRIQSTRSRSPFENSLAPCDSSCPRSLGADVLVRLHLEIRSDYRCWAAVQSLLHLLRSTSDTGPPVLGWQSLSWKLCSSPSTINKSVYRSFLRISEWNEPFIITIIFFIRRYRALSDGSVCLPGKTTDLQSYLEWWYSWYSSRKWTRSPWCTWSLMFWNDIRVITTC